MRIILWLLRLVLFLLLFGFAVKNDQLVALHFYFGAQWSLPLVFVLLLFFAAGSVLGITATVASWLRMKREISSLRRQLRKAEARHAERAESPPPAEA